MKQFICCLFFILIVGDDRALAISDTTVVKTSGFAADTSRINSLIRKGNVYGSKGALKEASAAANSILAYSKKIGYKKGLASGYNIQGVVLYRKGIYDSSLLALNHALILAKELKDSMIQSCIFLNFGNAHLFQGNYVSAVDYYFQGLAIEERMPVKVNLKWYLNNIGFVFTYQKNYPKALEYTLKSKVVAEKTHDTKSMGLILTNIGWIYMLSEKNDSAEHYLNQSLKLAERLKDYYIIILSLGNLAELNIKLEKYDMAYEYAYRGYKLSKMQGMKDQVMGNLCTMGHALYESRDYGAAEKQLLAAFNLSNEVKSKELAKEITRLLSSVYEKKKDYKKAYEYYKLFSLIKDTVLNQENSKLITEMNTKYTTEKKEKEIELLKKNEDIQKLELAKKKNELDKQRTVTVGAFTGFLLIMIVAVLLFSRYRLKKKANDQLQSAFNLIEEKNIVIEKSNVLITDSITYAKRIQDAILPAREDLANALSDDFFVLYQPAQIVSGDFYWCSSHNNKTIFVVADCTGHGVPGAFMSMIGNTLLNEIVNERKVTDTKEIAHLLDEKIISSLHQHSDSGQYDGMDISICCIDKNKNEISFTGAHHAMYALNGHLQKVKGDSYAIGGAQQQNSKIFTSQTIAYQKGLQLYFLTDGYCDQSGGTLNKRFSSKQFETLLTEVQELQMEAQKEKLKLAFENWKGDTKQRDDVLVVGIKC